MTISEAQARALAEGFLNTLGVAGEEGDFAVIQKMLAEGARVFLDTAADNLKKANAVNTGELASSLTFRVEQKGKTYILSVGYPSDSKAADYYDFVNQGVVGFNSNNRGATGKYKFRSPNASKKFATLIKLWAQNSGLKATTRDARNYTLKSERKGARLSKGLPTLDSLSYAIATNIKQKGLRGTRFFDNAVRDSFGEPFRKAMEIALAADVKLQIRKVTREKKK